MTRSYSFNLVDEPWIPCMGREGKQIEELSLRQILLGAHELQLIIGDVPPVTAALYRLLLAILHDELGPKNRDVWQQLWAGKHWDPIRINRYMDENKPFFDLFDRERPFYQVASMDKVENPVTRLFHHVNSPTLFEHTIDATGALTPAQAARGLLMLHTFALAHGPGSRPAFDGAWARDVFYMLQGDSVFETLLLNMVAYPHERPMPSSSKDRPAWRMKDPFKPKRTLPLGYLDYLTWQSRQILLQPITENDEVVVRKMMMLPGYKLELEPPSREPFKLYFLNRGEGTYRKARFERQKDLWRDSTALFSVHKIPEAAEERASMWPPYTFHWIRSLRDVLARKGTLYHYSALGMSTDVPPQNKVFFYRHEQMPLPLEYLDNEKLVLKLRESLAVAENVAIEIKWATRKLAILIHYPELEEKIWTFVSEKVITSRLRETLWRKLKQKQYREPILGVVNDLWGIDRNYWAELEEPFLQLTLDLPNSPDNAVFEWERNIRNSARQAFDLARSRAGTDAKALRAMVITEKELNIGSKLALKHLAQTTKEVRV